jgi:hypothetical protein
MRERFLLSVNTWSQAIFVCSFCTVFAACTGGQSIQQRWARSPEAVSPQPAEAAPLVYYTGVDELVVYSEPRSSASQLTKLSLHQKVYRYKMEKGYAYIKVEGSGVDGWVDNARLIWRLPSQQRKSVTKTEEQDTQPTQEVPVEKGKSPTPTPVIEATKPEPMPTAAEAGNSQPMPTTAEAPTEQEPPSSAAAPTSVSPAPPSPAAPLAPRPISPSIFNPF